MFELRKGFLDMRFLIRVCVYIYVCVCVCSKFNTRVIHETNFKKLLYIRLNILLRYAFFCIHM